MKSWTLAAVTYSARGTNKNIILFFFCFLNDGRRVDQLGKVI